MLKWIVKKISLIFQSTCQRFTKSLRESNFHIRMIVSQSVGNKDWLRESLAWLPPSHRFANKEAIRQCRQLTIASLPSRLSSSFDYHHLCAALSFPKFSLTKKERLWNEKKRKLRLWFSQSRREFTPPILRDPALLDVCDSI